jgi:hypothetical protein
MFKPCNLSLERLVEHQAKAKALGHERRQQKMQRGAMPPEIADHYARVDAAVLIALETLHRIEQHEPDVLERHGKPPAADHPHHHTPR